MHSFCVWWIRLVRNFFLWGHAHVGVIDNQDLVSCLDQFSSNYPFYSWTDGVRYYFMHKCLKCLGLWKVPMLNNLKNSIYSGDGFSWSWSCGSHTWMDVFISEITIKLAQLALPSRRLDVEAFFSDKWTRRSVSILGTNFQSALVREKHSHSPVVDCIQWRFSCFELPSLVFESFFTQNKSGLLELSLLSLPSFTDELGTARVFLTFFPLEYKMACPLQHREDWCQTITPFIQYNVQ